MTEPRPQAEEPKDDAGVYKTYLKNVRLTEELQSDMIKGIKQGQSAERLLLKCAKALSLTTGSDVFYREIEKTLIAVYGDALGHPEPMQVELEESKKRMQRIAEAMAQTEDVNLREAMDQSIRAHRERINYLEQRLTAEDPQAVQSAQ